MISKTLSRTEDIIIIIFIIRVYMVASRCSPRVRKKVICIMFRGNLFTYFERRERRTENNNKIVIYTKGCH